MHSPLPRSRQRGHRPRLLLQTCVLLGAMVLTACGSDGGSESGAGSYISKLRGQRGDTGLVSAASVPPTMTPVPFPTAQSQPEIAAPIETVVPPTLAPTLVSTLAPTSAQAWTPTQAPLVCVTAEPVDVGGGITDAAAGYCSGGVWEVQP